MATYYVRTDGSNSNNGLTDSAGGAWLTINYGVAHIAGGDTLIVKAGTYTDQGISFPPAGSAGAYTIIKGDPSGARPKLSIGAAGRVASTAIRGLYGEGSAFHHVEVRYFEFDSPYEGAKLFGNSTVGFPHHITFADNVVHDTKNVGFLTDTSLTGFVGGSNLIQNNTFYNVGIYTPGYVPGMNCIYNPGNDSVVEGNLIYDCTNGIGVYLSTGQIRNCTIRYNYLYQIGRVDLNSWAGGATGFNGIHVSVPGGGHNIYRNIIRDSGSQSTFKGIKFGTSVNSSTTGNIFNNTIYNTINASAPGITCTFSTPIIKNNLVYLTPGGIVGGTQQNNRLTDPSFLSAGTGDFSLASGSPAVNAGVDVGLGYNGALPDQGAFEQFAFASASVENGATTTLLVNYTNTIFTPLLPATGITGFTSKKNGANNPVTAAVRSGTNQVALTLTNAIANGDTVLVSYSGGNLTNSALIGNTYNQAALPLTNQAVTNNVSGVDAAPAAPTNLVVV